MVKILMGLAAAVVIAVGGFFGFEFYTQHRVASEVEAAFEQIRAGGGKASHGKVSFDLRSRTLKIADIATESATQPPVSVKIASIIASGVGQPDATRFSADAIEITDFELNTRMAVAGGLASRLQGAADRGEGFFRPGKPAAAAGIVIDDRPISIVY